MDKNSEQSYQEIFGIHLGHVFDAPADCGMRERVINDQNVFYALWTDVVCYFGITVDYLIIKIWVHP